jgi:hypothetical protein
VLNEEGQQPVVHLSLGGASVDGVGGSLSSHRMPRLRLPLWFDRRLATLDLFDLLLASDEGRPAWRPAALDWGRAGVIEGGASELSAPRLDLLALFRIAGRWNESGRDDGALSRGRSGGRAGPDRKRRPARLAAPRGELNSASMIWVAEAASSPPTSSVPSSELLDEGR